MRCIAVAILVVSLGCTWAPAAIQTKTVEYKVGDTTCKGMLAWDDSWPEGARRPGVIVVPEWWGVTEHPRQRADMLARIGFVAFVADMYGDGKTTGDPKQAQAWMEDAVGHPNVLKARFMAAVDVLKKSPQVNPAQIGAIGFCFGGGVVLNMARAGVDLKGVVSFHGGLATENPAHRGAVKARILVCHGADDTFESPQDIAKFQQEMTDAGADWQLNIYGSAVHSFTNPNADKFGIPGVAYNAAADRRSWAAMQLFFTEAFGLNR